METPEVVVERTSKEAIEAKTVEQPVEKTEETPVEQANEPVKAEGEEAAKQEEKKPEDGESSVIRQMRKQLRVQQKMIAELRQSVQQPQPEPRPTRESFQNEADYIQAEVAYQVKQQQQAQPKAPDVFETKWSDTRKEHPDFEEALEDISHVMFTPEAQTSIRQAVETLPYGGDVLYHIAKNPELAEELAILPPAAFAARLGDIHGDIRRAKTTKQVSKAPAPIAPVSGSAKVEKAYDDITDQAEFVARRRKERMAYQRAKFGIT